MRATFDFDKNSLNNFDRKCQVAISKVGFGTKKATIAACEDILNASLAQVPSETGTLESSGFWEIDGNWRTGWTGVVGYGGHYNPINPKTGKPASYYMMYVHENLNATHIVGKAKFLEDPAREYARVNFPRTVFKYASESLADL